MASKSPHKSVSDRVKMLICGFGAIALLCCIISVQWSNLTACLTPGDNVSHISNHLWRALKLHDPWWPLRCVCSNCAFCISSGGGFNCTTRRRRLGSGVWTKVKSFAESGLLIMMCLIADLWGRPIIREKWKRAASLPCALETGETGGCLIVTATTQSHQIRSCLP